MSEVKRLPLWKGLLDEMLHEGLRYGKTYDAAKFEEALACNRSSFEFGIAVHKIRLALEQKGFHLKGHVQREGHLVLLPIEKNLGVVRNGERSIRKRRIRNIRLLNATDPALLPKKLRSVHQKLLLRNEIRLILEKRATSVARFLKKKAPGMLASK